MLATAWWDSHVFEGYDPDLPLRPEIVSQGELNGYSTEKVFITGLAGERIPLRIIRPHLSPGEKALCVVFLYGIGQSAQFFDQIASIFASQDFAMAMPEQYQCGERRRRDIGVLRKALYEAAGHPKEKINYEGVHAEVSESTVRQMLMDALQWLRC